MFANVVRENWRCQYGGMDSNERKSSACLLSPSHFSFALVIRFVKASEDRRRSLVLHEEQPQQAEEGKSGQVVKQRMFTEKKIARYQKELCNRLNALHV